MRTPSTWNHFAYRLLSGCVPALLVFLAASPTLAAINAGNVAALTPKGTGAGVTARPVLANGFLYLTSWDGFLYALDSDTGVPVWSFDTGSGSTLGVQSTLLVTTLGTRLHR